MKLRCEAHDKRSMVIVSGDTTKTIHRQDGSKCDGTMLRIGPTRYIPPSTVLRIDLTRNPGCVVVGKKL